MERVCDICGGALTDAGSVPGYQEPNSYAVLDCRTCYTMVASPRKVDARVYNAIYAVPGGAPGYDRYFHYARQIVRARNPLRYLTSRVDAAWGVYQALRRYRAVSILEAGCGLGYFTYALGRAGYDVLGIDVSQEAVTQARRAYGDLYKTESIESFARSSEQTFDAVVMVEVIEHLENPIAAIQDALRLLSSGACLVLTTPNRSYYGYDEIWATDLPPVHLWWFSEKSIQALAARVGCICEFIDFSDYNARFPVLHAFRSAHSAMLDPAGRLLRRESLPMSLARRAGLLHEGYWLASRAAGLLRRPQSPNRPTMVAVLRRG